MAAPLKPHHARQIHLLLALMSSTRPLTSDELFGLVPDYRAQLERNGGERSDALEKKLERDRADLHESGFHIVTVPDPEAPGDRAQWRYQLESSTESVGVVGLDAQETLLIDSATKVWLDRSLDEDARRSYLKLLPSGESGAESTASQPTAKVSTHPVFAQLRSAIAGRKRIGFDYVNQDSRDPWPRTVDPLRLIVKSGRWLLHAWDVERDAHRTYLVNRIVSEIRIEGVADPAHTAEPGLEAKLDALAAAHPVRVRARAGTEAEARMRGRGTELGRTDEWVSFEVFDWDHGVLTDEFAGLAHLLVVESPESTREGVEDRLQRALELHEGAAV
ncbi:helix-turn-helix transcriptional regulator [Gulosibacter sp. ACHW.36C]|uniref:WYL domain-containing protein n=1 Tax=Gulosibacter sediminis TaxID=1729695 RepID=A0ABY4N4A6_9MICO|nr:WYL domain-containing protein [Gulosibacter sediminis]UQN16048.1 WYL domain-containing protein [Gulosibacter sediminis]